jgi:hypothetical protein
MLRDSSMWRDPACARSSSLEGPIEAPRRRVAHEGGTLVRAPPLTPSAPARSNASYTPYTLARDARHPVKRATANRFVAASGLSGALI